MNKKNIIILGIILVIAGAIYFGLQQDQQPPVSQNSQPTQEGFALTPDEEAAFDFPSENASSAEVKKHLDAVNKIAEDTNTLDITNCVLKPLVLRADVGSEINVSNDSDSVAVLEVGNQRFNVPAGGNLAIKASFLPGGGGLYGYSCNVSSAPDGLPGSSTGIFMLVAE